jgi:hypothetical protein
MAQEPDMRHMAVDVDWKNRRFRIGSSIPWMIALIVVACNSHPLLGIPVALAPNLLKLWRMWRP